MAENEICSFLDADFRKYDRFVVKLPVGNNKAVIFGDCLVQTMLPLAVVNIDIRPWRSEKNLIMITLKGRERLVRRSPCSAL